MSFTRLLRPHAVRAACAALALSLSGLALAEPIKVGYLPVTGHAKFFVAKEQGLFAQEGLDVELVEFQNSADGLNAVVAGKLDVGAFGTTAPVAHISKGANLKIVGGIMGGEGRAGRGTTALRLAGVVDGWPCRGRCGVRGFAVARGTRERGTASSSSSS